jgi:hypothetical protein
MANKAIFTYGRMNPPTIGHKKLIKEMLKRAKRSGATPFIVITHTQNKKKNPLKVTEKVAILTRMFPGIEIMYTSSTEPNPNFIAGRLEKRGFKNINMMVGSDQVKTFEKFVKVPVLSGGIRDPNSNSVSAMSATKLRDAAKKDPPNWNTFRGGINKSLSNSETRDLMDLIRGRLS